jgi:hypothetical protein
VSVSCHEEVWAIVFPVTARWHLSALDRRTPTASGYAGGGSQTLKHSKVPNSEHAARAALGTEARKRALAGVDDIGLLVLGGSVFDVFESNLEVQILV